jgi:hypothetical protein
MAGRLAPLACVLALVVSTAVVPAGDATASGTRSSSALAVDLGVLQQLNRIRASRTWRG